MNDSVIELLRKNSIQSLFNTATFTQCWTTWQPEIRNLLGANFTENEIINLGDHLSDIFKSTGGTGRTQGDLSAGGTAWESLICWYINLCSIGSRVVAVKKMSLVPKPIQDAITVNYGNFSCNTESDITVIVFPNEPCFTDDAKVRAFQANDGEITRGLIKGRLNPDFLNLGTQQFFDQFELGIIQCKTNWNDNAQIPMLWDMIYSAGGFRGRNITIGKNGFSIQTAKLFTYSFVTVPSNIRSNYKSESVAVKRVTNLSGGNYWGKQTEQNVAKSIKEIFTTNFQAGYNTSLRASLANALGELQPVGYYDYFRV